MAYIPYEKMTVIWDSPNQTSDKGFTLTVPWLSMHIDVNPEDEAWITDAVNNLHTNPLNENVQKFIHNLKDYPLYYTKPRKLSEFEGKDLQECSDINIDSSSPVRLIENFGSPISDTLIESLPTNWTWDQEKILSKARIEGTDLYDPVTLVQYLTCYRLDWESDSWVGQDGLGNFLEILLEKDEEQFFQAIGTISRQAWQVMTEFSPSMEPALTYFAKGKEAISAYMSEEIGHNKFMEQVFKELDLDKDDFNVTNETRWLLDSFKRAAHISPLAFSAMVGLFEASYYEDEEPIATVIHKSSKPKAGRGWDLHRKVNMDYRHCDVVVNFASHLAPQTRDHALLLLGIYEFTLKALDKMEQRMATSYGILIPNELANQTQR
jgi:hypothetical protein